MVDTEIIRTVFGVIGNVISFGLFVLSVPTFCRILKNKSVKGVKPEYHLAAMINCLFWVFYGMPFISPRNIHVLTAHGIGLAIHLPYLIIILLYANNNKQRIWVGGVFLIELVIILVIGSLIILAPCTVKTRRDLVAVSSLLSNLMVLLSEISYAIEIMFDKSFECVEIRIVWGKTLYALCWIIYGSLKYDPGSYFLFMQVVGFAWEVFLLKVYDVYYKNAAKSAANKKLATVEVQVQGMGTGADKLVIAGMGTGADKKLARAGMGTGAGKKLAIDPLQLQENGTA